MNVVYDLLGFQSRDHGERGIARYVLHLALALERTHPGLVTQYLVRRDLPFPAGAEALVATGRIGLVDSRETGSRSSGGGVFIAGSPFECYNQPSDLVTPRFVRSNDWRRMVVLHDLIPGIFPELYLQTRPNQHYYGARLSSLSLYDHYLVNSQATADDAISILGITDSQVTLIGAGADRQFRRPAGGSRAVAAALATSGLIPGIRPGYILFPTGMDPRKNIERTIHAYGRLPARLRNSHQLVLACSLTDADRKTVEGWAAAAGVGNEFVITGYVSDATLCHLYQGAHLVVFPSYYEGFGLPALEAMHCGAPVICADATSLVEVQPLAEARFDPLSVRDISSALIRALSDDDLRHRLREQTPPPFTWDLAGQLAGDAVLAKLAELEERRIGLRHPKPRLALFAPLPPQQTGVATYTYRLLEHLRHHCDVTVFVDTGPGDRARPVHDQIDLGSVDLKALTDSSVFDLADFERPEGVAVTSTDRYEAVAAGGGAFDQTLYFLGNSRFHLQALQANKVSPGHVLMHDVRLTELYRAIHSDIPERLVERSVGATLAEMYPGRYRPDVEAMEVITAETAHRFGVLMAKGVANEATQLLVHSDYAKTLLHLDSAGAAITPFPMPCPAVDQRWEPNDEPMLITAFGPISPWHQPESLISALPTVLLRLSSARLRFVGRIDAEMKERLLELAARKGVAGSVDFVVDPSDEEFVRHQRETSLAVLLRSHAGGGSSETVAELLALGVPTVATNLGPVAELPDDVVIKVDHAADGDELGELLVAALQNDDRRMQLSNSAIAYAAENSFSAAAEQLAALLFSAPPEHAMPDVDKAIRRLKRGQQQTNEVLATVRNSSAAYLGDHRVIARMFNGQDIYVDGRDTSVAPALILDGHWEPETTAVMTDILRPEHCMIDVGANFGYFGTVAGSIVDPRYGGSVHLIEANPHLVSLMEQTIQVNDLAGAASVSAIAISDRPGELRLQVPKHLWGSSNLDGFDDDLKQAIGRSLDEDLGVEQILNVPAIDLDRFTAERDIDTVDLIKIDIEGHEERAYRGMTDVIDRNRGRLRLLLEFSSGQYEDPVGFFRRIRHDFGEVSVIHPASGRLVRVHDHGDLMELSRSGFAMLLAGRPQDAKQHQGQPVGRHTRRGRVMQRSGNR